MGNWNQGLTSSSSTIAEAAFTCRVHLESSELWGAPVGGCLLMVFLSLEIFLLKLKTTKVR